MSRAIITMTIDDAAHYSPAERAAIIASYPEHEREARANGVPTLGSGRIFPVADAAISVQPFQIPSHWPRINGIDFGWDHPVASVRALCAPSTHTSSRRLGPTRIEPLPQGDPTRSQAR